MLAAKPTCPFPGYQSLRVALTFGLNLRLCMDTRIYTSAIEP
jgi:hypothetical protein